jgi:small neutral amino acid transporter SnatA (MarC family)
MYDNKTQHSVLDAAIPSAIGAGVVTSFAVSQGQHPALAIGITLIVTLFAVICDRSNLV